MERRASQVSIEDIENTLGQVAEIQAARVVVSSEGLIEEIHVLALPNKSPKQLVRDIESTLMASFGIAIDHKKISIAQLGGDVVGPTGTEPVRPEFRVKILSINAHVSGVHSTVTVSLDIDGETCLGEAFGPASQTGRVRLVAMATLDAINKYISDARCFGLEDVAIIPLGRQRVAVSCVTMVSTNGEESFSGSALVHQNDKDSIVKATLDAINRRLGHFLTVT
ncbi:MAG: hypothetical protein M1617_02020 [Actinobacteria bacterium]|nr:hypothetical protein [Actinomycetota bacterium]MCL5887066.1 hypothetical protein [Actinomycetota bacterium]